MRDCYRTVFAQHRIPEGFAPYVAPTYIQHNPRVTDGRDDSIHYLSRHFAEHPQATNWIVRIIA